MSADCVVEIGRPGTLTNSIKALAVGGHISRIGSSLSRSGIMLDPLLLRGCLIYVHTPKQPLDYPDLAICRGYA
jgi:hypothetical protein